MSYLAFAFTAMLAAVPAQAVPGGQRPNILWLVTEDNSVDYLRLYTPGGAPMPAVERLAAQGIVFNNAFSNAPVCSSARSAIISGCYGPRTFTQFHRPDVRVPLPEGLHMFPWYLRQAGYYTTNNAKEDYNFIKQEGVWDASSRQASYRGRAPGQPFFHVQNFEATHEGRLHFPPGRMERQPTVTDPATVPIFPIHPDTPLFRYTNALYRDLHVQADREIGQLLAQLEADGLMEDTIIFYYGDNGGALPGSKGCIYERGVHVPMVVHVPEKWRHLLPEGASAGSRIDGFVQFVDLAPTVLNLAGIHVPEQMDGRPFLGGGVELDALNARDTAYSYADRFDEKYDLVRAVRRGRFKYLRNYQPFNPDALQNNYRYRMAACREWRELYKAGKLTPEQAQFFEPRPAEALFDLEADPFELHNLAGDIGHRGVLEALRGALREQVVTMPDLSFFPEPVLLAEAAASPAAFGQANRARIARLVAVADLGIMPFAEAQAGIAAALAADDRLERYWGLIVCSSFGKSAESFAGTARALAVDDPDTLVRVRAAEFLALAGLEDPRPVLTDCLKQSRTRAEAALVLNTIALLQDSGRGHTFKLDRAWLPAEWFADKESNVLRRYMYLEGKL